MHLGSKCFKSTYCTYFRSDFVHILLSPNYATNIYHVRFILKSKLEHEFCRKNPKYFAVYEFDSLHHKNRSDKKSEQKFGNKFICLVQTTNERQREKMHSKFQVPMLKMHLSSSSNWVWERCIWRHYLWLYLVLSDANQMKNQPIWIIIVRKRINSNIKRQRDSILQHKKYCIMTVWL